VTRPLIVVPARFTERASAIRFRGEVVPRALLEAIYEAGGEPLAVHPHAPGAAITPTDVGERLRFADGVLLPGGGDLDPQAWGGAMHAEVYDVDAEQDAFDLAVAAWAFDAGKPLLAVCRGTQVLNVSRGGTLVAHMDQPHRGVMTAVEVGTESLLAGFFDTSELVVSCHHHQEINDLGKDLTASALSVPGGTIEAIEASDGRWVVGVQWHPEDSFTEDPLQRALLDAHVDASREARADGGKHRPRG
jgi:putative glutamine amidotransferase